jgi:hypothetical protein
MVTADEAARQTVVTETLALLQVVPPDSLGRRERGFIRYGSSDRHLGGAEVTACTELLNRIGQNTSPPHKRNERPCKPRTW